MKRALIVLALSLAACSNNRVAQSELEGTIRQLSQAVYNNPDDASLIYLLATYHDRAGNPAEVTHLLERLESLGWSYGVNSAVDFRKTQSHAGFEQIAARLNEREQQINRASRLFTLAGHADLIPEGIAYDPVDDVFYFSSLHRRKVVRVDRNGAASDFVAEGHDDLGSTLGLKVDAERRQLWVVSSVLPEMKGYTAAAAGRAEVRVFDLRDGKLARRIPIGDVGSRAIANDLALLPDGSALLTDSGRGLVLRIAADSSVADPWLEGFGYPNGIAATPDGATLFVADYRGVTRVNVADKSRSPISARALIGGIDGLSMHRGKLIAIQNLVGNPRVIRIDPDSGSVEVLESRNAAFDIPTTGVVVGDDYYFAANSQLRAFNDNHTIWPAERLRDPVVLRLPL